jgi:hypothetical protein
MNYSIIIYFLLFFIRITVTFEYDDDDNEKHVASHSGKSKYFSLSRQYC